MSSVSTLSTAQIEKAFRTTPPKPKSKREVEDFVYDPAYDELLEAENFNRRVTELEDEGQIPAYLRYLRSALCLVIHDSPFDEDIPLLKGLALCTNSPTLRQQALNSLQLFLVDCSGDRDARLKPAVQQLLHTFEKESHGPEPLDTFTTGR